LENRFVQIWSQSRDLDRSSTAKNLKAGLHEDVVMSKMNMTKSDLTKQELAALEEEARKNRMQQILPRLWLGSKRAFDDEELLRRHNISHIVSVMPSLDDISDNPDGSGPLKATESYQTVLGLRTRLVIPVFDLGSENLLRHFPVAMEFIDSAISNGGTVLVHCLAGASRSPTVVAAYLMETQQLSPQEAMLRIRTIRARARPPDYFVDQLYVYQACDYRPTDQAAYLHWQLRSQCQTDCTWYDKKPSVFADKNVLAAIPTTIPYYATQPGPAGIVCKKCETRLAPKESILSFLGDVQNYFLAQPVDWMEPEFENREHVGELNCLSCEQVVGEYSWNGLQNENNECVSPAFILHKQAVREQELWCSAD
jgi:dual specificity phosphatase 12